ncbi:DUF6482 family protein [Bermanella sp. R86510]|uniref:DUF6482 family protein n=1 Tax=unclassified Bermanella TaxID=2627862 RepID=UPI0037CC2D16
MKMTLEQIHSLNYAVDKIMLVSICGQSYQLFVEDQGVRFPIYDEGLKPVMFKNMEQGKDVIRSIKCKQSVLYQQLPYDEACVNDGEMSPSMEIPLGIH